MAKHRTALGRVIDMSELISRNEKTRAVGNMKVNARGDTIDNFGKIVEPVTSRVNERYAKTVGNRSAQPVRQPAQQAKPKRPQAQPIPPRPVPQAPAPSTVELTEAEKELEREMEDDIEVEQIRLQERN